jgi:hypothetical protein
LVDRYKFLKTPTDADFLTKPLALKFEGGSFTGKDGAQFIVNLTVHDDGIIAETRASTEESDRFLSEALSQMATDYGLPDPSEVGIERIYASELIVQLNLRSSIFNKKFQAFIARMHNGITNNPGLPMNFGGLLFAPDPTKTKKNAPFRMEPYALAGSRKDVYYCVAPVPTDEHLELLAELEKASR